MWRTFWIISTSQKHEKDFINWKISFLGFKIFSRIQSVDTHALCQVTRGSKEKRHRFALAYSYSFDFGSGVFTIQSMNVKVFRSRNGSVIGPGFPSFCFTGETYSPCEIPRGWNINHRLVSQKPSLTSLRPRRTPWPKMCEERQGNSSLPGKWYNSTNIPWML